MIYMLQNLNMLGNIIKYYYKVNIGKWQYLKWKFETHTLNINYYHSIQYNIIMKHYKINIDYLYSNMKYFDNSYNLFNLNNLCTLLMLNYIINIYQLKYLNNYSNYILYKFNYLCIQYNLSIQYYKFYIYLFLNLGRIYLVSIKYIQLNQNSLYNSLKMHYIKNTTHQNYFDMKYQPYKQCNLMYHILNNKTYCKFDIFQRMN